MKSNKATVRALLDAFQAPDPAERLAELLAEDYREHAPRTTEAKTAVAVVADVATIFEAFPDLTPTVEIQVAEGEMVATRLTWRGTHTGDYAGVAPTGKPVEISVHRLDRVADGKVAESWVEYDPVATLVQIGAVPPLPHIG